MPESFVVSLNSLVNFVSPSDDFVATRVSAEKHSPLSLDKFWVSIHSAAFALDRVVGGMLFER